VNLSDDKAFRKEHAVLIEKLAGNLTSLGLDINASRARDAAVSQLKAVTRIVGIWHGVENSENPTMFDAERWLLSTHGYKHAMEFFSALHSADKKKRVELQKRFHKHRLKKRNLQLWQIAVAWHWCVQPASKIPPACLLSADAIAKIFALPDIDRSTIRQALRRPPLRLRRPADFVLKVGRIDRSTSDAFWLRKVNSRLS
jgi:hypothetical protein